MRTIGRWNTVTWDWGERKAVGKRGWPKLRSADPLTGGGFVVQYPTLSCPRNTARVLRAAGLDESDLDVLRSGRPFRFRYVLNKNGVFLFDTLQRRMTIDTGERTFSFHPMYTLQTLFPQTHQRFNLEFEFIEE